MQAQNRLPLVHRVKSGSDMTWRALPRQTVECYSWKDEFVFYNSLAGTTHLLGPLAAQIMFLLQKSSFDSISLVKSLAFNSQGIDDAEHLLQVEEILTELHSLTLIERS
jgi:PqqD family protein of HPr-rel-A system